MDLIVFLVLMALAISLLPDDKKPKILRLRATETDNDSWICFAVAVGLMLIACAVLLLA